MSKYRYKQIRKLKSIFIYGILAVYLLVSLFPVYWMVVTSFQSAKDVYKVMIIPRNIIFKNYIDIFIQKSAHVWLRNSLIVALASGSLSLLVSLLAAYSFLRLRFIGRRIWLRGIILMYVMPSSLLFIPLFIVFSKAGLLDSLLGLILAHTTFQIPFATWLLLSYFRSVPGAVIDAARIDGCTNFKILWKIMVPICAPAIGASWIFAFQGSWKDFIYASVIIYKSSLKTISLGLAGFLMGDFWLWGQLMAAATVCLLPPIMLWLLVQRSFVKGLSAGAVKQ